MLVAADDITIQDIQDLRPACYGCTSSNTRVIHPSAGFNDSGKFIIQCGQCGRVRTVREEHMREMLSAASGRPAGEEDVTVYYQVAIYYRSEDYQGSVHATYVFADRHRAQQEADTLVERYEKQFGWASAYVVPIRLAEG
mgnify:CR=1 FL=1|jgi:hypothetical protein